MQNLYILSAFLKTLMANIGAVHVYCITCSHLYVNLLFGIGVLIIFAEFLGSFEENKVQESVSQMLRNLHI